MKESVGVICYRYNGVLEVFLVHSTGINGVWSFPKGELDENETLFDCAIREFEEETTYELPTKSNHYDYLGSIIQSKGTKTVHAFAIEYGDIDPINCISNMCEYPIGSGQMIYELDEYVWYTIDEAYKIINPKQIPLLDNLVKIV